MKFVQDYKEQAFSYFENGIGTRESVIVPELVVRAAIRDIDPSVVAAMRDKKPIITKEEMGGPEKSND